MEEYSVLKRNDMSSCKKTWRKYECVLLSEQSQFKKAKYCVITTVWTFKKRRKYGDSKKISVC